MRILFENARWAFDESPVSMLAEDGCILAHSEDDAACDSRVDLESGFVLPAFVDCHCHILATGLDMQKLHLGECSSREQVLQEIREHSEKLQPDEWLLAVHYDQTRFEDGKHLTARDLDSAAFGRPTVLRHASGHACIVNSEALKRAGPFAAQNPPGGKIERDDAGSPTGVLFENAMELVYKALPKPSRFQMRDAIFAAGASMNAMGIASAADMLTGCYDLEDELWAYEAALQKGAAMRFRFFIQWSSALGNGEIGRAELPDSENLSVRGLKLFADGALGAGTAALYEPYETGGSGMLIDSSDELREKVMAAERAGFAVAVHSIGDHSTDVVLEAIGSTQLPSRNRVEHVMLLSDEQIAKLGGMCIPVTLQPEFLLQFRHSYERQLGKERAEKLERLRSLDEAGIPIGLSSDRPIVSGNPWRGIFAASERPGAYDLSECISARRAAEMYTQGAATLNGDRDAFGSLKPGQKADFQVYEWNPFTEACPPRALYMDAAEVLLTTSAQRAASTI